MAARLPGVYCCASGCNNSEREHPGKVFYLFPTNPESRAKWMEAIERSDLKMASQIPDDMRVCSDHFTPDHYNARKILLDDAVPSLLATLVDDNADESPVIEIKSEPSEDTIEIEFESEEPTLEDPITIIIENQSREKDPLSLVKSEPEGPTSDAATQTYSRKQLYLSVATSTGPETISLPPAYRNPPKTTVQVQTTKNLVSQYITPVKRQLEAEIREVNKRLKLLDSEQMDIWNFMMCCDKYLNEKIANIVKSHSRTQEKYNGNRYGHDFKIFALNLHLSNPQSFRFVEKIFNLPSRVTLQRLQTPTRSGINSHLMEYLKVKVNKMSEREKVCAICFDVMHISRNLWYESYNDYFYGMQEIDQVMGPDPAEYCATLIVRSLYTKWTQPISFAFISNKRCYPELKEWLHKVIWTMFDIGLNIKVFVSDLETEFMDVLVQQDLHHFEIDGRRIYYFYDVNYLFKSARDAFMEYNFHVGSKVVQWGHVLKVYDKDKNHDLSLMPKITNRHVRPGGELLKDVNLAIEVFSKSVAAAMNFYVTTNMVSQAYCDTIEFIANMSNLYDILTTKAFRGTTEQNQILLGMLEYLQDLEVRDELGDVIECRFVSGLLVNIRSVLALLEELKLEGFYYLPPKVLSKGCVEAFFDECRRLGGNCCERPTAVMLARFFRRLFLVNLVNNDGENEHDLKSTLYKISDYMQSDVEKEPEFERIGAVLSGAGDYKIKWPSNEYLAGYILWKCLEKHKCSTFFQKMSSLYDIPIEDDAAQLLQHYKKYNGDNVDRTDLLKPPQELVEFLDHLDQKYCEYLSQTDRGAMNFIWNAYRYMEEDTFELPCNCFPLKFLKILFIRLKVNRRIREYNAVSKHPRRARPQPMKVKRKKK